MPETDKTDNNPAQPGQIIAPGAAPEAETTPPAETPETPPAAAEPAGEPAVDNDAPQPETERRSGSSDEAIAWTASEFVAHQKSAGWYGGLAVVTVLVATVIYLLTKDAISTGVVVFGAIVFGIYAARQPRQLEYKLDDHGVAIAEKYYSYQSFRSFSLVPEGAFSSIVFMPLKRFAPLITIYYAPEHEDQIIDLLSDRLPFAEYQHDPVDRLMKRIRF